MPYKDVNQGREHARNYYDSHKKERTEYKKHKYNTDTEFKERVLNYNKQYRTSHPENYSSWKKTQSEKHKLRTREKRILKYGNDPQKYKKEQRRKKSHEYRKTIRDACIEKITSYRKMEEPRCWRCGQKNIDLLTIAHVDGTGNLERKFHKSTLKIYKHILSNSSNMEKYNIECFNCNMCEGFYGKYPDELNFDMFVCGTGHYMSKYRKKHKLKAFEIISIHHNRTVSCHICGETALWCLSIAHLDNSGYLIRDKQEFARRISKGLEPLENLEIECFNCNCYKEKTSKSI